MSIYDHPTYYEIAFSFRDIPREIDVFEQCFRRFARTPVHRVLELACGHCPHMEELAGRGYEYVGLDINDMMIRHGEPRALGLGGQAQLVRGDMIDFRLDRPVEFAYVLLGSLFVLSAKELARHLDTVATALRPGGLYLLECCVEFGQPTKSEGWEAERDGIRVKTRYEAAPIAGRLVEETIVFEVDDHGRRETITGIERKWIPGPRELKSLIDDGEDFELLGSWTDWDLRHPADESSPVNRPITLLRRR